MHRHSNKPFQLALVRLAISLWRQSAGVCVVSAVLAVDPGTLSNSARRWPVFLVDDRQCILQCAICCQTLQNSSVLNESRRRPAENISSHGTTEDSAYDGLAEATRLNYLAIACIFFVPGEVLCDLEAVNGKCADLGIAL